MKKEAAKVLIVDDEPLNLDVLEEILQGRCETAFAESGELALKEVQASTPDLVLLDVMMPGIDGYDTCKLLRANPDLAALKIVMISAKSDQTAIAKGLAYGADDYVAKPFDENTILDVIERYI